MIFSNGFATFQLSMTKKNLNMKINLVHHQRFLEHICKVRLTEADTHTLRDKALTEHDVVAIIN
jgi:hypothetical protein